MLTFENMHRVFRRVGDRRTVGTMIGKTYDRANRQFCAPFSQFLASPAAAAGVRSLTPGLRKQSSKIRVSAGLLTASTCGIFAICRDAALTLRSYGRHDDCKRLLANIRELIAGPSMGLLAR